jgi:hypothetical protein
MSEEVTTEAVEPEVAVEATSEATAEGVTEEVVEVSATEAEIPSEEAPQAVQQAQEVEAPVEPEDNAVRSQLGRKVKYMEDTMNETLGKLDAFLQSQSQPQYQQPQYAPPVQEEVEEEFLTNRNVGSVIENYMTQHQSQQSQEQARYENDYVKMTNRLASEVDETDYTEINTEMMTNFNVRHGNDASADAERNWLRAERAVLRKRQANPVRKAPLKQEKPSAPLGGGSVQNASAKKVKMPKFDDATLAYMKKTGMTEERAAKILGNAR